MRFELLTHNVPIVQLHNFCTWYGLELDVKNESVLVWEVIGKG